MNDKKHYIYALIDPRNGEVKYIGRTTNPKNRMQQHCKPSGNIRHSLKEDWIGQLRNIGLSPEMEIIEIVENGFSAALRERAWIRRYQSTDNKMSNAPKMGRPKK